MEQIPVSAMNITPTHKVGIKLFTQLQLENIFPDYRSLLGRIETHRNHISRLEVCNQEHYQYNLMYDNVFSILGKRGTGKTSVVFTLKKMLEENPEHSYDIILPIIIPEMIPTDYSVLGWMLAIIKQHIERFEQDGQAVKRQERDICWKNCKYNEDDGVASLKKQVDRLIETYYAIKYNPSNEKSFNIAVGNSARQIQDYYCFAQRVAELWEKWVKAIKERMRRNEGEEVEAPLIYFIFDDVDLAPEKVDELLSVIIKYLSHPNIIVITTADEEMFLEVTENKLDKNIGRLPKEWRTYLKKGANDSIELSDWRKENIDLISQTARMYLGKVMPTSTRYYLKLFTNAEEKMWFCLNDKENLGIGMEKLIGELLQEWMEDPCRKPPINFLKNGDRILSFYFNFFGDTSRQIANTYLGAQEFIHSLIRDIKLCKAKEISQVQYLNRVFHACRYFIHLAVSSNHNLAENIDDINGFVQAVFRPEYNDWKMYLDYAFLAAVIEQRTEENPDTEILEAIKMAMELYSLSVFVENVLLILESCTAEGITQRQKIYGISELTGYLSENVFHDRHIFRNDMDANTFFDHYGKLFNRINYAVELKRDERSFFAGYFQDLMHVGYREQDCDVFAMQLYFNQCREWFGEMSGLLSMVFGNLYLISVKDVENCQIYRNEQELCSYQRTIRNLMENDFRECLDVFHVMEASEKGIEEVKQELKTVMTGGENFEEFCAQIHNILAMERIEEGDAQGTEKERIFSLDHIIRRIDKECKGFSLIDILKSLKGYFGLNVKDRLVDEIEYLEDISRIMRTISQYINEWDINDNHQLYLSDIHAVVDGLYSLSDELDGDMLTSNMAERLSATVSSAIRMDQISKDMAVIIDDKAIYNQLKKTLEDISVFSDKDQVLMPYQNGLKYHVKQVAVFKESVDDILKHIDIAVRIDNRAAFEKAVNIGLMVQLAKNVQRIYLYRTVLERYHSHYNMYSKGLERKKSGENTYYYQIFLAMNQIVEERLDEQIIMEQIRKRNPDLTKEEKKQMVKRARHELVNIRNFIRRCAFRERTSYLLQIIKEVKDEPVSY